MEKTSQDSSSAHVSHRSVGIVLILALIVLGLAVYLYVVSTSPIAFDIGVDVSNSNAAVGDVVMSVKSVPGPVLVGQQFTVDIELDAGNKTVSAADFRITFPQASIEFRGITAGPFLPTELASSSAPGSAGIIVGSGTIGKTGTGIVATLTFRALQAGTVTLGVDPGARVAAINQASNVLVAANSGTVTITVTAPTVSFSAAPTSIKTGLLVPVGLGSSTVSWTVQNSTSASINQGIGVVSATGTQAVSPTTTTTYTLTALNGSVSTTGTTVVTVSKIGDLDNDQDIDIFDYSTFVTAFGQTGVNPADMNGDARVDIFDYNIIVTNFNR